MNLSSLVSIGVVCINGQPKRFIEATREAGADETEEGPIASSNRSPPGSQHSRKPLHIRGRSDLLTERDISFCATFRKPLKRRGLHPSPRSIERMQNKICCL